MYHRSSLEYIAENISRDDFDFIPSYMVETHIKAAISYIDELERRIAADTVDKARLLDENYRFNNYKPDELLTKVVDLVGRWLQEWSYDLYDTRDEYIAAVSSGKMHGRPIKPELAKAYARDFGEHASAVHNCIDPLTKAILELKGK